MGSYLNPASFNTPNNFKADGMLGGFLAGMNQDIANQGVARDFRDQDLEYAINQLRQQKDESNLGVTQADNANKILAAQILQGQYGNGMQQQLADSGVEAGIAGNQAKTIHSKAEMQQAAAPIIVRANETLKARGGSLDPKNQSDIDFWNNDVVAPLTQLGVKGVSAFPDHGTAIQFEQWAQNAKKYLNSSAEGAINTVPYQQAVGQIGAKGQIEKDVEAQKAASAENVANIRSSGQVKAAEVAGESRVQVASLLSERAADSKAQLEINIKNAIKTAGPDGAWSPEQVGNIEYLALQYERAQEELKLANTVNFNNPQARAEALARAKQQAIELLKVNPGYAKAKGLQTGNEGASSAPMGSSGPTKINSDEEFSKLPSGALFIGPDGKTRKKP